MNDKLIQIGLDSGMLNYVDNETPRHYFLSGHADEQDLQKFAELIVRECVETLKKDMELAHIQLIPLDLKMYANGRLQRTIKEHFGVES